MVSALVFIKIILTLLIVFLKASKIIGRRNSRSLWNIRRVRADDFKPKRILCLGDSLTEGFYNEGQDFHPYSNKLSELLNAQDPTIAYEVENEGVSGERVHNEMIKRLPKLLKKHSPLDLVIILGGTNDLNTLNCVKDVDLFNEIKKMHEQVHDAGMKTVAVTIPEADVTSMPVRRKQGQVWAAVNKKLREYAQNNDNVILFDLAKEIPFKSLDSDLKEKFWDDNLHFTPKGYDKMGKLLFKAINGHF